jgi:hypothetical protein
MGAAFVAATREIGGELKLMGMMGYDATTILGLRLQLIF